MRRFLIEIAFYCILNIYMMAHDPGSKMPHKPALLNMSLFFILTLLLVSLTFYNSFQRIVTVPQRYSLWIIVHAFSMAAWVIILLVQVLLIYFNNYKWHKQIGLLSIGIVILIIVTTVASSLQGFTALPDSFRVEKKYSILFSQLYGMLLFALLYTRALLKAKVFNTHVQCIMASLVVILGPVIFRASNTFHISLFATVELTCNVLTYGILNLLLMVLCAIQVRKKESFGVYLFTIIALIPIEFFQVWFCLS